MEEKQMKVNQQQRWARVIILALLTVGIALIPVRSLLGQSQDQPKPATESQKTEADLLKERLLQLEKTVSELKEQLNAIEAAKKKPQQPAIVEATYTPSEPASAENVPAKPKQDDDKKGESTFQIYGFAMLDAGYQFKSNHADWFDVLRPTKLPSFPGEFGPDGKTFWDVRQSRLGVKSSTPTKYGELKTIFEFELFGTGVDAGQTTFRLRHAYGELGHFGAGQTWSPFMDPDVFPNSLEYWGPNGMVFFRNVQFRWMPLKGKNSVTIALERPGASGDQGQFADRIELQGIKGKFDLPDVSGNVRFTRDWGHVQIAGILRRVKWVDTFQDDEVDLSGKATSGGVNVSSNLNFGKNDIGRFSVVYGRGIQNYMNDAPVDIGIKKEFNSDTGAPIKGVALPVLGVVAFLDHNWNKKFSSSVGYSMVNIENSDGQTPDAYHRGHYALGNLLFYPIENVTIGGEFQWGRRENFLDGFRSDDYRIQFSFKYNFSKTFKF
jgi:hypothetical protein